MRTYGNNIWIMAFILFGLCSCWVKSGEQSDAKQVSEITLDQIKLTDLSGHPIDLDQYRGKTIFINFWATWCRPCIEEMPSIERAQSILKGKNIEFLFASNEEIDRIQNFASKRNLTLNFVQLENQEDLNLKALPTTFIFNPEGKFVFNEMGFRRWDDSENIEMITKIINSHE